MIISMMKQRNTKILLLIILILYSLLVINIHRLFFLTNSTDNNSSSVSEQQQQQQQQHSSSSSSLLLLQHETTTVSKLYDSLYVTFVNNNNNNNGKTTTTTTLSAGAQVPIVEQLEQEEEDQQKKKKEEDAVHNNNNNNDHYDDHHPVAHLSCKAHGGPDNDELVKEMIYWRDIPADSHYKSPYHSAASSSSSDHNNNEKYLTFEPDEAGWNNMRMAMETVIVLAIITGRTLVLPPSQRLYMLWHDHKKRRGYEQRRQKSTTTTTTRRKKNDLNAHTFDDFFPLLAIANEHAGLNVISLDEYLQRTALRGKLHNRYNPNMIMFPPNHNRTDWSSDALGGHSIIQNWESSKKGKGNILWNYIRNVTTPIQWNILSCVAAFPTPAKNHHATTTATTTTTTTKSNSNSSKKEDDDDDDEESSKKRLLSYLSKVFELDNKEYPKRMEKRRYSFRIEQYNDNPTPVYGSPISRLRELIADRRELCFYDNELQDALTVHVWGEQSTGYRFLIHYYAFYFFEDYKTDLWMKRFVRDHIRYVDDIQCAAARVVLSIRKKAYEHQLLLRDAIINVTTTTTTTNNTTNNNNAQQFAYESTNWTEGSFDTFHIRRGDFPLLYKDIVLPIEDIYNNVTKHIIREGRTIYIATDEKNRTFFEPLKEHYHLLFLSDFIDELGDHVSPNYYGMIDQLIASRGDIFVGTYFSTFSGYINRIRGYHEQYKRITSTSSTSSTSTFNKNDGTIHSYYVAPNHMKRFRNRMRTYHSVRQGFWQQEFPIAWRDIDYDVVLDE